jgi:5-methylcytosine-specific restriction endonuclease McrA
MKSCKNCKKPLDSSGKFFARQVWCSETCSNLARAKRRNQRRKLEAQAEAKCLYCKKPLLFAPKGRRKNYCDRRHQELALADKKRKPIKPENCAQCQKSFLPTIARKQLYCSNQCREESYKIEPIQVITCNFCLKEFQRPTIKGKRPSACMACRTSGPARRYDGYRRYTNLVIARDNQICQICLTAVDLNANYQTKWSPTLDHIIPRSRNGSHEPENLRLAHRWCNSIRQDKD